MKITVIIPVYNVADYLCATLDSVIHQTFSDIEIICVNDGSTDTSPDILAKYAENDNRIVVINQENRGLYEARRSGINVASGDYIVFVDGDDWLDFDACERLAETAENSHADVIQYGLVVESEKRDDMTKGMEAWFNVSINSITDSDEMLTRCYIERAIPWNIATKAIKTTIAKKAASCQEQFRINQMEDFVACFYIFLLSSKWVRLEGRMYHYRYGTGMSTKPKMTLREFENNLEYFSWVHALKRFVDSHEVSDVAREIAVEVIPQAVMDDAMGIVFHRLDLENSPGWVDSLAKSAGDEKTRRVLATSLMECYAKKRKLQKSKRKYVRLFRLMSVVSLLLLLFIIFLLTNH